MLSPKPADLISRKAANLLGMGWVGVDLFFVLSGFLITGILLSTRDDEHYFGNFYARRCLRIFPLYYLVIPAMLYLLPLMMPDFDEMYKQTVGFAKITYLFYAQNMIVQPPLDLHSIPQLLLAPTWSLAVEEHFYLVWPTVVFFFTGKRLLRLSLALIAGAICVRFAFLAYGPPLSSITYVFTFCRMDSILAGALLAAALLDQRWKIVFDKQKWNVFTLFLGLFIAGFLAGKYLRLPFYETLGYTVLAGLFGSVVNLVMFLPRTGRFVKLFDNSWCRCFGKYSYAIYLFHIPAILLARWGLTQLGIPHESGLAWILLLFSVSTCISLAAALFTWHAFEKRFLALKRYFGSFGRTTPDRLAAAVKE